MKKTYKKSRIVQFHHNSRYSENTLNPNNKGIDVVLQIEQVEHSKFDFIAEVISSEDYAQENNMPVEIEKLKEENEKLRADLRGKDNEIEVLKWRIEYLSKFEPKEHEEQYNT